MLTQSMRKLVWLAVATAALYSTALRPAYSNGLHHFFASAGTIEVICGHDTIGSALKRYPLRALVIVVKGTCAEDVVIERNRVTLMAETPRVDGVVGLTEGEAAITVDGAQNVVIDGLRIRSAPGSSAGLFVTANGEAAARNVLIDESADGIWANHGGFVRLQESEIRGAGNYGLLLTDAADARIENSIVEVGDAGGGGSAAIGAFRSINIRLRGANQIHNKGAGFSLDLFHNVELRQDGGHTRFTGPIEFGNLSHGSLRDPEIIGAIDLFGGSRADIRPSSTSAKEITGASRIRVSGSSQLELRSGTSAEVNSIEVHDRSALDLRDNVDVVASGDANLDDSTLSMGRYTTLAIDQSMSLGRTVVRMGESAHVTVGGDVGAFTQANIGVFGPHASLEVAGTMAASAYVSMNIGPQSTLTVGNGLSLTDFSILYAEDLAAINADLEFGGSINKVNFFGDGLTYTGNLQFSPESSLDFGPNNVVDGSIDCGGGDFSVQMNFMPGASTIVNCLSWP